MLLGVAYSVMHTATVGSSGYYFLPARLFEFLSGAVLALALRRLDAIPPYVANLLVVSGIAAAAVCSLQYGPQTVMPGTNAILPCLAALLLIAGGRYAGTLHPVLSNRPLRYVGRISYPLYLWHWPLIFACNRLGFGGTAGMCLTLGLSVVLAALTHRWIETPWRARSERPRLTWLRLWCVPFLLVLGLYVLAKKTDHFSVFYPQKYRTDYVDAGRSVFDHPRAARCWGKVAVSPAAECTLGTPGAQAKAVLWGDSHAYHQIGFLDAIGKARKIAIHDMAFTMCAPVGNSPQSAGDPAYRRHAQECRAHDIDVMKHILADPTIRFVFMSAVWDIYGPGPDGASPGVHGYRAGQFETELGATITRLNAAGKRVIMLDDIPILPEALDNCASDRIYLPGAAKRDCSYSRAIAEQNHHGATQLLSRIVQAHPGTAVIDTHYVFCDAVRCHAEIDGVALYKHDDRGHLSAGGSRIFYQLYMRQHPRQLEEIFGANEDNAQ